jgi:hypothetical protein
MHSIYLTAHNLPPEWDVFCKNNVYMQRDFLTFMEKVNPCGQKYYMLSSANSDVKCCFIMFTRKQNLFEFKEHLSLKVSINFIYLPLSVSNAGIVSKNDWIDLSEVLAEIKGLTIILSLPEGITVKDFANDTYLPTCCMDIKWRSFEDYIASLRGNYRYRYNKALKLGKPLQKRLLTDPSEFTPEMYRLYEQVFQNSKYKLEKLNFEFFKNTLSKTIVFEADGVAKSFVQLIESGKQLIFEFGGLDYADNHKYDLYINLLLEIVRYACENGFERIDFGQTAEDAKLKLGGYLENKNLWLWHSNKWLRWIFQKNTRMIAYKQKEYRFNVFRSQI